MMTVLLKRSIPWEESFSVPFAFYNAPKLDKYLKDKYGKGYDDYVKKQNVDTIYY
ncbi:hypothetical protein [Arachidicoccus ginsenosidimutans]|uniref:hypothetical protein n=1 Tax=Arachidicoccus sp. BS20 TaxID=1850526 RepID=UPI0012E967E6|nr:hypothetical protein [Arachidicoccus sp. BS20]